MDSLFSTSRGRQIANLLVIFLAVLSLFFLFKFINEVKRSSYIGSEAGFQNTITVSGEGEVFAVPDTATFSFTVRDEQADATNAQETVTYTMNKILDRLEEFGVEEKDIKTTSYNIYPQYDWVQIQCITYPCPGGERQLRGYEVSHSVRIKVQNADNTGELLSIAGEMGADNVSGITFEVDDEDALKVDARKAAIADARDKAERLADDLGVKLGKVVSFHESGDRYYARSVMSMESYGGDSVDEAYSVPSIPTGENKISSNVSVTYEIR